MGSGIRGNMFKRGYSIGERDYLYYVFGLWNRDRVMMWGGSYEMREMVVCSLKKEEVGFYFSKGNMGGV